MGVANSLLCMAALLSNLILQVLALHTFVPTILLGTEAIIPPVGKARTLMEPGRPNKLPESIDLPPRFRNPTLPPPPRQ